MQVIWTDPALERVDEIAVYIARDDPDAAARWTVELFAAVSRLVDFPESGRTVPELGSRDVRELSTCIPPSRPSTSVPTKGVKPLRRGGCGLRRAEGADIHLHS